METVYIYGLYDPRNNELRYIGKSYDPNKRYKGHFWEYLGNCTFMKQAWLPYLAGKYIRQLKPKTVFEWGSGESTFMFLRLGAQVVSIEHDWNFYEQLRNKLWRDNNWIEYKHIPFEEGEIGPDKANPEHYKSGSTLLGEVNFKRYASVIDEYDLFDLILIDGLARPSCIKHAFNHVKRGGCLVIDNTNDRPYYLEQTIHLFGDYEKGWERVDFFGYGPILEYKWQTTFFINKTKQNYET